jgi:Domain of unknown function (DUF4189)
MDARRDDVMLRVCVLCSGMALAMYAVLAIANPPSKAGRTGAHGAIAYHAKTGAFGFSFDFPAARQAKESALAQCGESGCVVMVAFRNSCAALVQGEKRPFISQGATRDEAQTRALNKCNSEKHCKPVVWACTK